MDLLIFHLPRCLLLIVSWTPNFAYADRGSILIVFVHAMIIQRNGLTTVAIADTKCSNKFSLRKTDVVSCLLTASGDS